MRRREAFERCGCCARASELPVPALSLRWLDGEIRDVTREGAYVDDVRRGRRRGRGRITYDVVDLLPPLTL